LPPQQQAPLPQAPLQSDPAMKIYRFLMTRAILMITSVTVWTVQTITSVTVWTDRTTDKTTFLLKDKFL
jgi:hypothetical protein